MKKIRIGIAGGAGYTGGELIRILLQHPHAELVFVQSKSNAGQPLSSVHQDLAGETDFRFSESYSEDVDVLFLCVGHGEARKYLRDNPLNPQNPCDRSVAGLQTGIPQPYADFRQTIRLWIARTKQGTISEAHIMSPTRGVLQPPFSWACFRSPSRVH